MADTPYGAWMRTGFATWALGIEASAVIGMRIAKTVTGRDLDGAEARMMIAEKVDAAWTISVAMMGLMPLAAVTVALHHYRGKVEANRRRLSRTK